MSSQDIPTRHVAPQSLETTFATTADGTILEIPLAAISGYAVSPDRRRELGHLPILPYNELLDLAFREDWDDEVCAEAELAEGRHMTPGGDSDASPIPMGYHWHRNWLFGAYVSPSGNISVGIHRHPFGDDRVEEAEPSDFS